MKKEEKPKRSVLQEAIDRFNTANQDGKLSYSDKFKYSELFNELKDKDEVTGGQSPNDVISVQSLQGVATELLNNKYNKKYMIVRVEPGTFRLVVSQDIREYFLIDEKIFKDEKPKVFIPSCSARELFTFQLLPKFTETSCVNLAFVTGLMAHALNIEHKDLPPIPATGQGTYSFTIKPHKGITAAQEKDWKHDKVQVDIDSAFIAKRKDDKGIEKEFLFVVEAKAGRKERSLAKTKLVYPICALRKTVPKEIEIIPVYLRVFYEKRKGFHFYFVECEFDGESIVGLDENKQKPNKHHYLIPQHFCLGATLAEE